MTPEALARHAEARRTAFAHISAVPERFKVCTQCHSTSYRHAAVCFICGAYRFDEQVDHIAVTAIVAGRSPFPFSAGTVPRLQQDSQSPVQPWNRNTRQSV